RKGKIKKGPWRNDFQLSQPAVVKRGGRGIWKERMVLLGNSQEEECQARAALFITTTTIMLDSVQERLAVLASQHHASQYNRSRRGPQGSPCRYLPLSLHLPEQFNQLRQRQLLATTELSSWCPSQPSTPVAPVSLQEELMAAMSEPLCPPLPDNPTLKTSLSHPINISTVIPPELLAVISSHALLASSSCVPTVLELPLSFTLQRLSLLRIPRISRLQLTSAAPALPTRTNPSAKMNYNHFRTRSNVTDALQAAITSSIEKQPIDAVEHFRHNMISKLVSDSGISLSSFSFSVSMSAPMLLRPETVSASISISRPSTPRKLSGTAEVEEAPRFRLSPDTQAPILIGNLLMSSCPGKKVRLSGPVRGRSSVCRDLDTDMRKMKSLQVGCIVCCLDDEELEALGAPWPEYERTAKKYNIDILRIPMPEGLPPLSPSCLDIYLVSLINKYTLRGIPVLVHCRGGVGRAGVVACCWMIRLGLCGWLDADNPFENATLDEKVITFVEKVIAHNKMSSFAKPHLKAAREAISKKDYKTAKKEATLVLDYEPENYNALVFSALASLELGEYKESEQIYRKATELNPSQPLAWQGLANFYERREEWDRQADTLIQLLELFNKSQDATKCAETLQKLVALYRKHGSRSQLIIGLSYYLPESTVYPLLSNLPQPDPTNPTASSTHEAQEAIHNGFRVLEEITALTEKLEEETLTREVEKRRTRLGAPSVDQLRKDVFNEVSTKSRLPFLYDSLLNHPNTSDELRAEIESKQLRYKQRYLSSIPASKSSLKSQVSKELDELVEGYILLKKADELAWKLYFESRDCEDASGYDLKQVRDYIRLFPTSALASLFRGYFAYKEEQLVEDEEDEEERELFDLVDEDPVDAVLNAASNLLDTITAHRFSADVYLGVLDYENAIKTSKQGLRKLSQFEADAAKNLSRTRTAFQAILATSLVNFFPPKHHKEASAVVDEILARSSQHISALMDRAFILQAASDREAAAKVFDEVASLLPDDLHTGLRAKEESAWCKYQLGRVQEGLQGLQSVSSTLATLEGDEVKHDRARCLWRIGKCYVHIGDASVELAYQHFINALKQDSEFAPAFTSLGIYYLEHASPPDPIRSSKCFQKAFELDAREAEAARRLAEGFANDREWDLVEVVAQRTIDGEGGVNAGMSKADLDAGSRYLPTNAWAWKALGVVKFHYRDYPAAIQAFQIALRVTPDDQPLWVRLGEAYNKAGRHTAALKALTHALELNPGDWLASYFFAEVKHCMGLFDEAIALLTAIRKSKPDEAGVLALLAQAYLDLGRMEFSESFPIRAEESFVNTIYVSLDMIKRVPGFRTIAWKFLADATFHLSRFAVFSDEDYVRKALSAIVLPPHQDLGEEIEKMIPAPSFRDGSLSLAQVATLAVHACTCRISLYPTGQTANSGAWYDLSVALQSWTTKASPTVDTTPVKEKVIEYLKKALQLEPANDLYWVALGNAYFLTHAKAAQHSYIKALEINSKNAATWVNLGLLYYYHSDVELANEALYRAQVLDPDNTRAWVGQFLIASTNEHKTDASMLLEHAVGLQTPVSEADYEYASQVFHLKKNIERKDQVQDAILPAFFVLNRYCQRRPQDPSGLHLLALVCERLGHYSFGEELVERAIAKLEVAYEETEDPEVERRYTIANATLGRLKFSLGSFAESLTAFESVLGLLAEKEAEDDTSRALKVQAHLGAGLAHFFQENLNEALGAFEEGLAAAGDDLKLRGHINIVLAQTLWALGTEEAKEAAKTRLLEGIASDPGNLPAINTLAGMGILTGDDGLVDAALSEILALPVDQKHQLDPQRHVDYLLTQHHLAQGDVKGALSLAQAAVQAEPSSTSQRNRLASIVMQSGEYNDALALLAGVAAGAAGKSGDMHADIEALSIQAVARASGSEGLSKEEEQERLNKALREAQRAIMMRPSEMRGWRTLAYVRGRMPQ
ncbi:hypothetical protein CVT26_015701, partial [Gymnopilus dilepis]